MALEIQPVKQKNELRQFITFPWKIYAHDPNWVPPLISDQMKMLNPQKGVFYSFGRAKLFIAYDGKEPVGRISAHVNHQYEKYQDNKTGFFGFFECVDDQQVANALFERAEHWLQKQKKSVVCGPFSFTLYDASGMLYQGFDSPPVILTNYNPFYYNNLLQNAGYGKAIDWYAFMVCRDIKIKPIFYKIRERVYKQGIKIKHLNMRKLDEAVHYIGETFNQEWSENWGHVPLTDGQLEEFKNELKYVVEPKLTFLAFLDDKCIGFSLSVKDANPALKLANGRLFLLGLFRVLRGMKKVNRLRTFAMGVKKEFRHKGLDILFYLNTIEEGVKMGYSESECSLIVETNHRMIGALENLNAKCYRTYRFYQKKF